MLSREDIDSLPDDPVEAFAALADLFDAHVEEKKADREGISAHEAAGCAEEIIAVLVALGVDNEYPRLMRAIPRDNGDNSFWEWWSDFLGGVRFYRAHAFVLRRKSALSVVLAPSHRSKIRALLARIREIVPNLKVSVSKHEKIFDLISKLENEVDRPRTRMEAFFALVLEGSSVGKQVGEDAKPIIEDLERITNVLSDAKDEDLPTPSLPAPKPKPQIEDKRPPARASKAELDDDIPF